MAQLNHDLSAYFFFSLSLPLFLRLFMTLNTLTHLSFCLAYLALKSFGFFSYHLLKTCMAKFPAPIPVACIPLSAMHAFTGQQFSVRKMHGGGEWGEGGPPTWLPTPLSAAWEETDKHWTRHRYTDRGNSCANSDGATRFSFEQTECIENIPKYRTMSQ